MPSTAAKSGSSVSTSGSGSSWLDTANVYTSNNAYASSQGNWALGQRQSTDLNITGFSFTGSDLDDTDTINGIEIRIERYAASANTVNDVTVQLLNSSGNPIGTNVATTTKWPTTDGVAVYGGPTNMLGTSLTAANIKAGIGVRIKAQTAVASGFTNYNAFIDHVTITVYYTPQSGPPMSASSFFAFF